MTLLKGLHGSQELCSSILNFTEQRETDVEREGEVSLWIIYPNFNVISQECNLTSKTYFLYQLSTVKYDNK